MRGHGQPAGWHCRYAVLPCPIAGKAAEGYGFFAFFCWPALSTDLYNRAESTDASDKTDNTLMKLRHEAMDSEEKAEPIDPNEKTEPIENAELTEPMLHTEFTDPMLRNEFREPMLFVFRSERAGASGALFSEDLEVVLDIINPAYRAARPYRTNYGAHVASNHAYARAGSILPKK